MAIEPGGAVTPIKIVAQKAHTSKIKKSISRKLSTANYETLDIHLEIEETIEWDTPAERMEKTENYTKLLIVDFMKTLDKVASTLGVDKKVAVINNKNGNNIPGELPFKFAKKSKDIFEE